MVRLIETGDLVDALRWTRCEHELAELLDVELDVLRERFEHMTIREQLDIESQLERTTEAITA